MRPGAWRWLSVLVGALTLAGCKSSSGTHAYPSDPLFVSKKPLEGKAENAPPVTLVSAEIVSPPLPYSAVVARYGPRGRPRDSLPRPQEPGKPESP
ncbi:MAG: hypothetical protein L0Z62_03250 [Gemmataceae bacterium]|nr:hypothetical protein [Gemmataceae bacterium]